MSRGAAALGILACACGPGAEHLGPQGDVADAARGEDAAPDATDALPWTFPDAERRGDGASCNGLADLPPDVLEHPATSLPRPLRGGAIAEGFYALAEVVREAPLEGGAPLSSYRERLWFAAGDLNVVKWQDGVEPLRFTAHYEVGAELAVRETCPRLEPSPRLLSFEATPTSLQLRSEEGGLVRRFRFAREP